MKLAFNVARLYQSYNGHLHGENAREIRLTKAKKLMTKLKHPVESMLNWFFTDEKDFCQDQLHNTQNNKWLVYDPYDVPRVIQSHILERDLSVNSLGYVEMLNTVVRP